LAAPGSLSGYVFDESGVPLRGVAVEAHRQVFGPSRRTFTNDEGEFHIAGLTPGRYRVRASGSKLNPVVRNDVTVPSGGVANVQFIIEVPYLLE
jgi:protocatechuate 3,4-dioxygenase beta subunit